MYKRRNNLNIKHSQGLIVGGIVFASVAFFPRITNWIESQGLNVLYVNVRITLVLIAIVAGILSFAIGRKLTTFKMTHLSPDEYLKEYNDVTEITCKKNKDEVIEKALKQIEFGFISLPLFLVIGFFSLYRFYFDYSSFLIFLLGISCTVISGLLAIYYGDLFSRKKVIKQYQSESISDMNDSLNSHTSSSESQLVLEINENEIKSSSNLNNDNSKAGNRRGIAGEIDWDNL
jgi:hypothetical protein